MFRRICVFCGSSPGARPAYASAAIALASELAARKIAVVYGGSNVGLMRILADTALELGGDVIGVIPQSLVSREVAHDRLSEIRVVASIHERKALMAELSDGFIALPGGFGTLDEFCEVLTWTQLGLQAKPAGLLNVEGYYDHLLRLFDHAVVEQFLKPAHRRIVIAEQSPAALIDRMLECQLPAEDKWIARGQT